MTQKILEAYALLLDRRTPRLARWLLVLLLAYVLSPVDLIPDFIPVLGLLDELVLVPLVLTIIYRLIPDVVKQESGNISMPQEQKKRFLLFGTILVVTLWLVLLLAGWQVIRYWK